MTYILNNYIANETSNYEPIIKDTKILKSSTLEDVPELGQFVQMVVTKELPNLGQSAIIVGVA